ncbi:MAG: hypothetical protein EOO90_20040 [Pedobacter sp.]|nr:MAG: hypothetical protein EOO90_20040 [Pedobacter sp.]
MNELAQFFTKEVFSILLANSIKINDPKIVIDLGIGDGSLTSAAQKRWKNAQFCGVDLDKNRVESLNVTHSNVNLFNLNSLDLNLSKKINIKVGSVDIAVCNPPYLNLEKTEKYSQLLTKSGLKNSVKLISYTTDLLFIAQNLSLLKKGGILGIILPAGLISGHNFELFRKDLVSNHSIENIIELESKIFKRTEAKTFILILKKGCPKKDLVLISKANKKGEITDSFAVPKDDLVYRMDFDYHANKKTLNSSGKSLANLVESIKRGNISNLDLRRIGLPYFHTTDFKKHDGRLFTENNSYNNLDKQPLLAMQGDILIGRVGKTCHRQILIVESGCIAISDCVYRIRSSKKNQKRIIDYLQSEEGITNLKILKHGVCAQVISLKNLANLLIK